MDLILTSGPEFSVKVNDQMKAVRLENKEFVNYLKKNVINNNNLLFICSNPDDYKNNEEYAKIIEKSLSLSGIKFNYSDLLDSRNWLFTKSLVKNSDLIILLGGNPLEQMEFFNNIELKDKIKGSKGCVLGISAGTVNMASKVYCSKDEDILESSYYKGLCLTNFAIEPHFDINNKDRINNILLEDSKKSSFIALPNESFITIKDNQINLYGDAYYFNEGNYKKITDINEIIIKKGI